MMAKQPKLFTGIFSVRRGELSFRYEGKFDIKEPSLRLALQALYSEMGEIVRGFDDGTGNSDQTVLLHTAAGDDLQRGMSA